MYPRLLAHIFLLIAVAILDVAFVTTLPFDLHHIHLLVIALVFVFLLGNIRVAAWWALGGGLFLEAFSFGAFGWHLAALLISLAVIALLFQKVMTNRSLYSISVVTGAAIIAADLVSLLGDYLAGVSPIISWGSALAGEAIGLVYNIILALAVFYISNTVTRQLHPGFLTGRNRSI